MKRLVLTAILALAACEQSSPAPPESVEWVSLPDGSKAMVGAIPIPADQFFDGPSLAMRCWQEADGHDCLIATRTSYDFMEFIRTKTAELPPPPLPLIGGPVGYQCVASVVGGWQESVRSEAGQIKLNVVSYMQHPRPQSWSEDDVEKLIRDNEIQPRSRWMNCRNLSEIVGRTSLAAVASTEVSRDEIFGQ